ncbi:hypothetical protein FNV43_RR03464 [Rhamnella rubrinervis]|uniref:Uncharacterized protein n=1 Tax=Rhamnella rubrinervis TaxID=2594499 RepID=A0A8K0HHS1_9ROSA|nr:hypothetical protein FNV43_RR03464 [Rhamnella rubrinervis]
MEVLEDHVDEDHVDEDLVRLVEVRVDEDLVRLAEVLGDLDQEDGRDDEAAPVVVRSEAAVPVVVAHGLEGYASYHTWSISTRGHVADGRVLEGHNDEDLGRLVEVLEGHDDDLVHLVEVLEGHKDLVRLVAGVLGDLDLEDGHDEEAARVVVVVPGEEANGREGEGVTYLSVKKEYKEEISQYYLNLEDLHVEVHGDLVEVDAHAEEEVQDVEDQVVALHGLVEGGGGGEGAPVAEDLASSLYS